MTKLFSCFHNTDNTSINLILTIPMHIRVSLLILFHCLFELNRIDFDAIELMCEIEIEMENVGVINVLALGFFVEHTLIDLDIGFYVCIDTQRPRNT